MSKQQDFDLIIVGGGLVGLTLAIGASRSELKVAVIDRADPLEAITPEFDGRASALAYSTVRMLDAIGLWQYLEPHAQPILDIRVSDGPIGKTSPLHLHFDHHAFDDGLEAGPLGQMVENRHTRIGLLKALKESKGITVFSRDYVTHSERDESSARVTLASGAILTAPLMVAADGRNSDTRTKAGIRHTETKYGQTGIVCAIEFDESHCGVAHERFLPAGPFAILPLTGNRASLVWTESDRMAKAIMSLSDRAFTAEIQRRVGGFLGNVRTTGGRWAYPLVISYADRYTDTRLALIGDAAHVMHPIAGQGLNLGLRDVAAFLEIIHDRSRLGLDIGSSDSLDAYAQWRQFDSVTLLTVTDMLNRLFSNDIKPIALARDLGMAAVDQIPPLKKFFMSHARGTVGKLPKLLRGEQLG